MLIALEISSVTNSVINFKIFKNFAFDRLLFCFFERDESFGK